MEATQASPLRLYTTLKSGPGRKALAVARELDLELEVEDVDVYTGEGQRSAYRALNPFGKIPTLVDRDFVLWESNAIAVYLAEQYGDYKLSSRDPQKRADLLRWMFWETAHFQPAFGPVLTEFVSTALTRGRAAADPDRVIWRQAPLWPLCEFLNEHLAEHRYVSGAERTVADFAVAGMFTYARAARFPFSALAGIQRWYGELASLPAWQTTASPLWDMRVE